MRRHTIVVLLCGAVVTGCLPIRMTYRDSPALEGRYRAADGSPIAGARVLLSTKYDDATCASPAARTITDAAGRFHLDETSHTERYLLLLPIDRVSRFQLCLADGDTIWPAFRSASLGVAPSRAGPLECFAWSAEAGTRASCVGFDARNFVSGGWWAGGGATGHYRFFTVIDPEDGTRVTVLAQWVGGSSDRTTVAIAATVDLSTAAKMFGVADPKLFAVGDRWQVHVRGAKRPGGSLPHRVVLELGPPGQVRLVR